MYVLIFTIKLTKCAKFTEYLCKTKSRGMLSGNLILFLVFAFHNLFWKGSSSSFSFFLNFQHINLAQVRWYNSLELYHYSGNPYGIQDIPLLFKNKTWILCMRKIDILNSPSSKNVSKSFVELNIPYKFKRINVKYKWICKNLLMTFEEW